MISAKNKDELLYFLSNIDISVPRRFDGRTTDHVERYSICYLLATLAELDVLNYPIDLQKSERPDFILSEKGKITGIEHTEAISVNVAHSDALNDKGYGPKVRYIKRSKPGEKKRKAKQLILEIEENKPSGPWMGDSVEKEWVEAMCHFTDRKFNSSKKIGYSHFEKNSLLIYDNWRLPALDLDEALPRYFKRCIINSYFMIFDDIYIQTDNYLCKVNKKMFQKYNLSQLWKN